MKIIITQKNQNSNDPIGCVTFIEIQYVYVDKQRTDNIKGYELWFIDKDLILLLLNLLNIINLQELLHLSREDDKDSGIKKVLRKINDYFILEPNIAGMGVNINQMIKDILKSK